MSKTSYNYFRKITAFHGKTFYAASLLMGKNDANKAYTLYSLCRLIDDIADNPKNDQNEIYQLKKYLWSLKQGSFIHYKGLALPEIILEDLFKGMLFDQKCNHFETENDLFNYCYQVAGTVGILICSIFNVNHKQAWKHAVDLGIGLQLTNISRDIYEDAILNRIYIPKDWDNSLSTEVIRKFNSKSNQIYQIQKKLLLIADEFYTSGYNGLRYLPSKVRFSFLFAAKCYQQIGNEILQNQNFKKRAYVGRTKKTTCLLKTLIFYFNKIKKNHSTHSSLNLCSKKNIKMSWLDYGSL
ncbi:phytoene/squalene synthase family protein [Paraphotobacterium marinum]|uniref:phytoene/squalene synthase family protein n=1 Tax=Paraphotobacterium marinum TaxID=1755811 RepID=UPI0039E85832